MDLAVHVHLVDGTYELFRHFYAVPSFTDHCGREMGAVRAVVGSILSMLEDGVTHVAVATDHVVESFRNALWAGYKDGSGIDPDLRRQFEPLEEALRGLGVVVWAMVAHEADDALGAGAAMAAADPRATQIFICTPDKDLAQCVVEDRVVQFDRRRRFLFNAEKVRDKFGVDPSSIPDYLALVGDSADGYPGIPGWGAKSSSTVLARYGRLEDIPADARDWEVTVRGASRLAATLSASRDRALLFRRIATIDVRASVSDTVDQLRWCGPGADFADICDALAAPEFVRRAADLASRRG